MAKRATERNANYVIIESKYLTGENYHNDRFKLDCSIKNFKYLTENADKLKKEERIIASAWAARCLFDRLIERDSYARTLNASSKKKVLSFLTHEHVIRLAVDCAIALRDWDDKWILMLTDVHYMTLNFPNSSLKVMQIIAGSEIERSKISKRVNSLISDPLYVYVLRRLKNAVANRKPLSVAFNILSGPVQPVVSNFHRSITRNNKYKIEDAIRRIRKNI